jgi:hypothetical protein
LTVLIALGTALTPEPAVHPHEVRGSGQCESRPLGKGLVAAHRSTVACTPGGRRALPAGSLRMQNDATSGRPTMHASCPGIPRDRRSAGGGGPGGVVLVRCWRSEYQRPRHQRVRPRNVAKAVPQAASWKHLPWKWGSRHRGWSMPGPRSCLRGRGREGGTARRVRDPARRPGRAACASSCSSG